MPRNDPTPRLFQSPPNSGGNDGAMPLVYDMTWQSFTNLTDAQQQWFRSQPEWLTRYAGIKRWHKEIGGITVGGIFIDTSDNSRALIDGLAIRAMRDQLINPSATYTLTSKGSASQLTIDQALGLFDAVSGFIQACRAAEGLMTNGANAAKPTVNSEAQIDAALAAVPTSF